MLPRTNNTKSNEANTSGNGSAQNKEESAGDQKQKNKDEKDSVSKKAELDEDDNGIVCLNDDIVEVEEGQSPAKKAELAAATGGATVAKPVTKEDSELLCMDWSYLETRGAKRRVGPPRVRTANTEPHTSGNGSAQNGEESDGDWKQKNKDEKDSVSKKAKLDEDDNGIVCLNDNIVEEGQSPAKKAELAAATGGATVAKPVTKEDSKGKKPYECSICNTRFAFESWLIRHTDSVHEGKRPHSCWLCNKGFFDKSKLKKHLQTVHKGIKLDKDDDGINCRCSKCDFVTSSMMKLAEHYNIVHEKNGAEANGSGNGSAQNREESAGDQKQKNKDKNDSVSKKAKLDEDNDDIVLLDDDVVEVEEGQGPAKKAELAAATGGATVAKPVTKEDSELLCMDWSYLETEGAKRRVGPPRVRTANTEPEPNVNLKQGSDKPT